MHTSCRHFWFLSMAPLCRVSQYLLLCMIQYNLNLCSKYDPGLYLSRDIIISCDLCWCLFIYALKLYSVPLHSFPFCFLFLVLLVCIPLWLISQVKDLFLGVRTIALNSISVFLYFPMPFQTRWELRVKLYQLNGYCAWHVYVDDHISIFQDWAHLVNERGQQCFQGCPIELSLMIEIFSSFSV